MTWDRRIIEGGGAAFKVGQLIYERRRTFLMGLKTGLTRSSVKPASGENSVGGGGMPTKPGFGSCGGGVGVVTRTRSRTRFDTTCAHFKTIY